MHRSQNVGSASSVKSVDVGVTSPPDHHDRQRSLDLGAVQPQHEKREFSRIPAALANAR